MYTRKENDKRCQKWIHRQRGSGPERDIATQAQIAKLKNVGIIQEIVSVGGDPKSGMETREIIRIYHRTQLHELGFVWGSKKENRYGINVLPN